MAATTACKSRGMLANASGKVNQLTKTITSAQPTTRVALLKRTPQIVAASRSTNNDTWNAE